MKRIILATAFIALSTSAYADEYVHGYMKQNGTYVQGYERTTPNNTQYDNYSTQGNVNPYTGQAGTVNPQPAYPTYQQPAQVYVPVPNTRSSYR